MCAAKHKVKLETGNPKLDSKNRPALSAASGAPDGF
jgi:hypothetical protein